MYNGVLSTMGQGTDYAQSEGMQVIWELDQDFIVKHPFQLDDSILGSLKMIAKAIDANFNGEVKAYMCLASAHWL